MPGPMAQPLMPEQEAQPPMQESIQESTPEPPMPPVAWRPGCRIRRRSLPLPKRA